MSCFGVNIQWKYKDGVYYLIQTLGFGYNPNKKDKYGCSKLADTERLSPLLCDSPHRKLLIELPKEEIVDLYDDHEVGIFMVPLKRLHMTHPHYLTAQVIKKDEKETKSGVPYVFNIMFPNMEEEQLKRQQEQAMLLS